MVQLWGFNGGSPKGPRIQMKRFQGPNTVLSLEPHYLGPWTLRVPHQAIQTSRMNQFDVELSRLWRHTLYKRERARNHHFCKPPLLSRGGLKKTLWDQGLDLGL